MPLQLLQAANAEPVSLAEAKAHLRVYDTSEDGLIGALISAARARAENECQRSLVSARWKLTANAFPGPSLTGVPFGEPDTIPSHALQLPVGEVLQVVSITYLAMDGTRQTMPATDYAIDIAAEPVRITPKFGRIWPVTLPQIGAVEVIFDAGHAAPVTAVDIAADTITVPRWTALNVGDTLRLFKRDRDEVGESTLPGPLAALTDYYVAAVPSPGVYKLAATAGGAVIDITSTGSGELLVGEIPASVRAWMLLAIGTLYENRQSIVIDAGITTAALTGDFLDSLLDPYRLITYP